MHHLDLNFSIGKTLYIASLARRVTEKDLERKFRKFGNIVDYKIVMDPILRESRGFGFVTYDSRSAADEAVREMDGYDLEGKDIIVQIAKRSKPRKSTPGRYLGYDKSRPRRRSRSRYSSHSYDSYRDRYRSSRRRRRSSSYSSGRD